MCKEMKTQKTLHEITHFSCTFGKSETLKTIDMKTKLLGHMQKANNVKKLELSFF